jgi:hypothetical protein
VRVEAGLSFTTSPIAKEDAMKTSIPSKILAGLLLLAFPWTATAWQGVVTTVSGKVVDETGRPLPGVLVHVKNADLGDFITDQSGSYRCVVIGRQEVTLQFSREGYQQATSRPILLNGGQAPVDDIRMATIRPQLRRTSFQRQQAIEGQVVGLDPNSYGAYKVVAYVLTNKWYIHPEAVNTPGLGFATIDSQGKWRLQTVWRGYQATKLAFLLVPRETWAPPTVELVGGRPETSLLAIEGVLASLVEDAPEGI